MLKKSGKNCYVRLIGTCRETAKCVIKMVKCGEHRHYGSDEASEAWEGGGRERGHVIRMSDNEMPETFCELHVTREKKSRKTRSKMG